MDFQLTADQSELRDAIRGFCSEQVDADTLRRLDGVGFDAALWTALADMGVFALRRSEADGGVGLGTAEAVLVFEALGRSIVPGPVLWTHLVAGLSDLGDLPGEAATGNRVVGGVECKPGVPLLVEHFDSLDVLIGVSEAGVSAYEPSELETRDIDVPLDPLTPVRQVVDLSGGEQIGGPEDAARLRLAGTTLAAAFALGIADAQTEAATAYAHEREQFGRPIGSFQAVKHILADMLVRTEVARAAVYAAGAVADTPEAGDPERAAASAKICADNAAKLNTKSSVQVHGGMGYTWELPVHYYLKRAWVVATGFGSGAEHAETIAAELADDVGAA